MQAGTYKFLGQRPWIYETSSEYLRGLILLAEAIDKLENTKLIIRVRGMDECSLFSLSKLLPASDTYEIIMRDEIPIINPMILRTVEKEIKPKLCFDRKCRIAIRVVKFIYLPDA